MKKKIAIVSLILALSLAISACGALESSSENKSDLTTAAQAAATTIETTTEVVDSQVEEEATSIEVKSASATSQEFSTLIEINDAQKIADIISWVNSLSDSEIIDTPVGTEITVGDRYIFNYGETEVLINAYDDANIKVNDTYYFVNNEKINAIVGLISPDMPQIINIRSSGGNPFEDSTYDSVTDTETIELIVEKVEQILTDYEPIVDDNISTYKGGDRVTASYSYNGSKYSLDFDPAEGVNLVVNNEYYVVSDEDHDLLLSYFEQE